MLLNKQVYANSNILTSLNRYERKKNIPLALKAFSFYLKRMKQLRTQTDNYLVVAGGWDPRVDENVEHE